MDFKSKLAPFYKNCAYQVSWGHSPLVTSSLLMCVQLFLIVDLRELKSFLFLWVLPHTFSHALRTPRPFLCITNNSFKLSFPRTYQLLQHNSGFGSRLGFLLHVGRFMWITFEPCNSFQPVEKISTQMTCYDQISHMIRQI